MQYRAQDTAVDLFAAELTLPEATIPNATKTRLNHPKQRAIPIVS